MYAKSLKLNKEQMSYKDKKERRKCKKWKSVRLRA